MAFIIGAMVAMYVFSFVFRLTIFRKLEFPKKQIYSIALLYPIVAILYAFGAADGGELKFVEGFIDYGFASVLLVAIYFIWDFLKKKKKKIK